jgi:hypothetical protein
MCSNEPFVILFKKDLLGLASNKQEGITVWLLVKATHHDGMLVTSSLPQNKKESF